MKRTIIILAIAIICFSFVPLAAHADNPLVNPGFETGDFTGWFVLSGEVVGSGCRTGSYCVHSTYDYIYMSSGTYAQMESSTMTFGVCGWCPNGGGVWIYLFRDGSYVGYTHFDGCAQNWSCVSDHPYAVFSDDTAHYYEITIDAGLAERWIDDVLLDDGVDSTSTPLSFTVNVAELFNYAGVIVWGLGGLLALLLGTRLGFRVVGRLINAMRGR